MSTIVLGKAQGQTAPDTEASLSQGQKQIIQRFCIFPSTYNSTFVLHLASSEL